MEVQHFSCGERELLVYAPCGGEALPLLCLNGIPEEAEAILSAFFQKVRKGECRPCVCAAVSCEDWGRDYSPWPAPSAFRGQPPFPGGAEDYLRFLTNVCLPALRKTYSLGDAYLLGYSLGGLQALWSMYVCDAFAGCGCLSGSLWYEGWEGFAASHAPARPDARIYLSLGAGEEKARNAALRRVGDATRRTFSLLQQQGAGVTLQWNPGGHFSGIPDRYLSAMGWLMQAGA